MQYTLFFACCILLCALLCECKPTNCPQQWLAPDGTHMDLSSLVTPHDFSWSYAGNNYYWNLCNHTTWGGCNSSSAVCGVKNGVGVPVTFGLRDSEILIYDNGVLTYTFSGDDCDFNNGSHVVEITVTCKPNQSTVLISASVQNCFLSISMSSGAACPVK